ncbi:type II secretion system protein [bacterium]|jgi:prepilin-type N-terminal cleavage/methylation domain-containing protein|nr:type II secretion system protein [bacterium]MBT5015015.1 type II secretion system protein [bacterium]
MSFNNLKFFKPQRGFTLAEVMLATAIMGLMLTSVLVSQSNLAKRVVQSHGIMARLSVVKNMFLGPKFAQQRLTKESASQSIRDPETKLSLQFIPGDKQLESFDQVVVERVDATWEGVFDTEFSLKVGALRFIPEPEQKKQ